MLSIKIYIYIYITYIAFVININVVVNKQMLLNKINSVTIRVKVFILLVS